MPAVEVDKDWFFSKLEEKNRSLRGLAKHMNLDPSAVSRIFSGQRKMQMQEAQEIAMFLGAPISEILSHAGLSIDLDGLPTRILLAATIGEDGKIIRLKEPRPLPQSVIDRAQAAIGRHNGQIIAAQVRASSGSFAIWDDAIVLFGHTDTVDPASIGVMSICRLRSGEQIMAKVLSARKTGEARLTSANGKTEETLLETATPVLAVIP
ncbi:DNA-binding protein [Rhizobium sp. 58]|nr:DNA-binding protein [Rhizobium sp. 58]